MGLGDECLHFGLIHEDCRDQCCGMYEREAKDTAEGTTLSMWCGKSHMIPCLHGLFIDTKRNAVQLELDRYPIDDVVIPFCPSLGRTHSTVCSQTQG